MGKIITAVFLTFSLLFAAMPAQARPVELKHGELTLLGNLELAEGKTLADGVLLMVHGTLGHHGMETIKSLQKNLKARGVNTLAVTLSLGIDRRKGAFDCNQPMRHRHEDALEEIAAWIDWLKNEGAGDIWLFGHSRGGNQAALYMARKKDPRVKRLVLLAPMTYKATRAAAKYKERFGVPLAPVLRQATNMTRAGKQGFMEVPGILYCKDARATPESFLSYHRPSRHYDTPTVLPMVQVPVLVLAGAEDELFPDLLPAMRPLAKEVHIELKVIADADHFFRDFASEDAADAIAAWLKGA